MVHAPTRSSGGRSLLRRRLAWPILILAVAVPVAFISGKLERDRRSAAEEFGQKVVAWDARSSSAPVWLDDCAAHPILLVDLRRRLSARQAAGGTPSVSATMEESSTGQPRWRVRLDWPDEPSISLLLAFEDLDATPHLVSVGGEQPMTFGATP